MVGRRRQHARPFDASSDDHYFREERFRISDESPGIDFMRREKTTPNGHATGGVSHLLEPDTEREDSATEELKDLYEEISLIPAVGSGEIPEGNYEERTTSEYEGIEEQGAPMVPDLGYQEQ